MTALLRALTVLLVALLPGLAAADVLEEVGVFADKGDAVVRWHESHAATVTRWLAGLPRARLPLWQVAQLPGTTFA